MVNVPVRYAPSLEQPIEDEEKIHQELIDTMRSILETTSQDYGHAVRSVHAKSHAFLEGTLTVADSLPAELAQGLFAAPGSYKAILRLSTNPGDILDDAISAPRGMAIKVLDVTGERLPDSQGETTQNFVMANGPAFVAPDPKAFLGSLKQLAATTDKAEWAKKLLSATLRGAERALEAVGGESAKLKAMGGVPLTHPLGDPFYSQTPFRYGDHVAKLALIPVSPNLVELKDSPIDVAGRADALREEVARTIIEQGGAWELRVQLNTDLDKMPIEDASVVWDEKASPYRLVGRIEVAPQLSWSHERAAVVDDQLFFSPWHGLAAHRPLGSINRARRQTYEMSSQFRGKFNGCPMHEPKMLDALPA